MRESRIAFAAKSRSASGITIAGALPPSSSDTFVTLFDAVRITAIPPSTLPVRLTIPTLGCPAKAVPTVAPDPETKLNTPLGRDDSATICANSKALLGVLQLGLITIVFPVTNAG